MRSLEKRENAGPVSG